MQLRVQPSPEQCNLHPNRTATSLSRPVEDCEGCPALAGVRNLSLDDPRSGRPDSHCNFGGVGPQREIVQEFTIGVPKWRLWWYPRPTRRLGGQRRPTMFARRAVLACVVSARTGRNPDNSQLDRHPAILASPADNASGDRRSSRATHRVLGGEPWVRVGACVR